MYISEHKVRVRYAETDQMNVVYHGNYAQYFEVGRVEAIRQLGLSYKDLEASGIIMPVIEWTAKFLRPAHYDDLLTVRTTLRNGPSTIGSSSSRKSTTNRENCSPPAPSCCISSDPPLWKGPICPLKWPNGSNRISCQKNSRRRADPREKPNFAPWKRS